MCTENNRKCNRRATDNCSFGRQLDADLSHIETRLDKGAAKMKAIHVLVLISIGIGIVKIVMEVTNV